MSQRVAPFLCTLLLAVGLATSASVALATGENRTEAIAAEPAATRVCPPVVLELSPTQSQELEQPMTTIVTSDYRNLSHGAIKGRLGRERKDGSRGRARMTVTIEAEPLVHNFDDRQLGKLPAEAIVEALREEVRGITATVAESTRYTRSRQEIAYASGKSWAQARFGFRGNSRPPSNEDGRHFNHSGTFADGIVATENKTEASWTVNVPANRLDPRTSKNAIEFGYITGALTRLAPSFADPRRLVENIKVRAAIEGSIEDLIVNAAKKGAALRRQLRGMVTDSALRVLGLDGVAGKVSVVFGDS